MNRRPATALFLSALFVTASSVCGGAATTSFGFDQTPYLRAQRLVDIGGRKLNLYCTGAGSPTVLLEAGGGDDMLDWRMVQPRLAKVTRVCSYDRAGYGFSDLGPLPRDASAIASDLHELVERAGIARPFVLAGYSDGESYARIYADRYVQDLAGLLLIEPAFEGDEEARADAALPFLAQNAAQQAILDRACVKASEPSGLQPHTEGNDACGSQPAPDYPAELNAAMIAQNRLPAFWITYGSEEDEPSRSLNPAELRREQRSYGALPLELMTVPNELPPGVLTPAQEHTLQGILAAGRAPIMTYSSRSSHVEAAKCNHGNLTILCASDVTAAILSLVHRTRGEAARPPASAQPNRAL